MKSNPGSNKTLNEGSSRGKVGRRYKGPLFFIFIFEITEGVGGLKSMTKDGGQSERSTKRRGQTYVGRVRPKSLMNDRTVTVQSREVRTSNNVVGYWSYGRRGVKSVIMSRRHTRRDPSGRSLSDMR